MRSPFWLYAVFGAWLLHKNPFLVPLRAHPPCHRRPVGLRGRAEPPPCSPPPSVTMGPLNQVPFIFLHPAGTSPDFLPPEALRFGGLRRVSARPQWLGRQEASGERRGRARGGQNRLVLGGWGVLQVESWVLRAWDLHPLGPLGPSSRGQNT